MHADRPLGQAKRFRCGSPRQAAEEEPKHVFLTARGRRMEREVLLQVISLPEGCAVDRE